MDIASIAECTYRWARASENQIGRIRENMMSEEYDNQIVRIADDHFLKIALCHLNDWLKKLEQYVSYSNYEKVEDKHNVTVSLAKTLEETCPHLRDYRNMGEHDIEYYKGEGRKQDDFIDEKYCQSKLRPLLTSDGEYLISGEISLGKVEPVVREIVEITRRKQFNLKMSIFEKNPEELTQLLGEGMIL